MHAKVWSPHIGIISDTRGNLQALDVVLDDIRRRALDAVYCLGDLVGYAPFPNEVIERIRAAQIPTIMGNYDDGVAFDRDECGCAYRERAKDTVDGLAASARLRMGHSCVDDQLRK